MCQLSCCGVDAARRDVRAQPLGPPSCRVALPRRGPRHRRAHPTLLSLTLTSTNPWKNMLMICIMTMLGSMNVTFFFIISTIPIGFIMLFDALGT